MAERQLVSFDWAMKKILRQKSNFDILEGFLSELFCFDIKIEEILESEANQESSEDKFNRVDLLAKNSKNELILIEVQYSYELDYFQRMLYGSSKLICEHIEKKSQYKNVKKVYSVNIIYFPLGEGEHYLYYGKTEFRELYKENRVLEPSIPQKKAFNIESIHQIFPEYYLIRVNQFNDRVKNRIDEWIYFLKNEAIKDNFRAKGLKKAKETLDMLKLSPKEREIYKRREENEMYKNSIIWSAEMRGERRKQIEIAKNLLDVLDIETIALKTGLSEKEIEELKKR